MFRQIIASELDAWWPLALLIVLIALVIVLVILSRRRPFGRFGAEVAALQALSPVEFEVLISRLYRAQGYMIEESGTTSPGVNNLVLHRHHERTLLRCLSGENGKASVRVARDLFATMQREGAAAVKIVTCGAVDDAAVKFAEGKPIEIIGPTRLVALVDTHAGKLASLRTAGDISTSFRPTPVVVVSDLNGPPTIPGLDFTQLAQAAQAAQSGQALQDVHDATDTPTPLCPRCNSAMALQVAHGGSAVGQSFWACTRAPACAGKRPA